MKPLFEQQKQIFQQAIQIESSRDRDAYLAKACEESSEALTWLRKLVDDHFRSGSFLEDPASEVVALSQDRSLIDKSIGPYSIREQIGEGGMGVVYVAEQTEPVRRKVALKVIKPGMDCKEINARFESERQALAVMEHPNIARIHDGGITESGRSYFVMELVRGIPITEFCDQARLSPKDRLKLFTDVCDAVQHAHQKGIIHRDIKPANVLVTQVDGKPVVKVIDFGLAKATGNLRLTDQTAYTRFMKLMGTPKYMSPEQAGLSGVDVDTRSDIYSLGVLLFELLTGKTPIDDGTMLEAGYEEICRQIREVDAPKPSQRVSTLGAKERTVISHDRGIDSRKLSQELRGDLDWVVLRSLEKNRARRYQSASAFAEDVHRFLNHQPVSAVAPSVAYLLRKYVRRHKLAIITSATIAVTLVVATVFSTWQAISATKAKSIAQEKTAAAESSERAALVARAAADAATQEAVASREQTKQESERRRRMVYASNMQLADQLWHSPSGKPIEIQNLLIDWIPTDSKDDLREFSWRYQWSRLHHGAAQTVYDVDGATLSLEDNLIVMDKIGLRQWDDKNKVFVRRMDNSILKKDERLFLSPCGRWVAIGPTSARSKPNEIRFVEVATGKVILKTQGNRVLFSGNGEFAFVWRQRRSSSFSEGGEVWNLKTRTQKRLPEPVSTFLEQNDGVTASLADDGESFLLWMDFRLGAYTAGQLETFYYEMAIEGGAVWSPNSQVFADGKFGGDVHVRLATEPANALVLNGHGGDSAALAFSPDSTRLAVGGRDGIIDIWDVSEVYEFASRTSEDVLNDQASVATGIRRLDAKKILYSVKGHVKRVRQIIFSRDGNRIATLGVDGTLKLWQLDVNSEYDRVTTRAEDLYSSRNSVTLESDSGGVRVTEVNSRLHEVLHGEIREGDQIVGVTNNSGFHAVKSGMDEWDVHELLLGPHKSVVKLHLRSDDREQTHVVELKRTNQRAPKAGVLTFFPDGSSIAIADFTRGAVGLAGRRVRRRYPAIGTTVAVSHSGELLAMDNWRDLVLWDLHNDDLRARWDARATLSRTPRAGYYATMAFSPDDKYIALGTGYRYNGAPKRSDLRVWEVATQSEVTGGPLLKNDRVVSGVAFTPSGDLLLAASHDGTLRIWDTSSWTLTQTLVCPFVTTSLALSPDGKTVAMGGHGVAVLDLMSGSLRYTLSDLNAYWLAFSKDGKTLVSTGKEGKAVLVDVVNGMYLSSLDNHSTIVTGCDFSPDNNTLATIDLNGNLRIWNAKSLHNIDRHPVTLKALFERGRQLNQGQRYAEAEQTLRRTLKAQSELRPPRHADLEATRRELVVALKEQGKYPTIVEQPRRQRVALGTTATFDVTCVNPVSTDWSYQWYFAGEPIENATKSTLSIRSVSETDLGRYHVEASFSHTDLGSVTLTSDHAFLVDDAEPVAKGGLRMESFFDVPGYSVTDLMSASKFQNNPDKMGTIGNFELPQDIDGNYGLRLTGFLIPPQTGDYVFYLCSDDSSQLFLSDNDTPEDKKMIASLAGWNVSRQWESLDSESISEKIPLQAGKRYWIEALFKERTGNDHFAVTWQLPDEPPPKNGDPPIPGEFLEFLLE